MIFAFLAILLAVTVHAQQSGAISNTYVIGSVSGIDYVGGISGSGGTAENSYFVGNATGTDGINVGGISGANATVDNSFYSSDFTTANNSIGTPTATAQMKMQSTYAGWNFENIWIMHFNFNDGYPFFQTQRTNLQDAAIVIQQPSYEYTGSLIKPEVTVIHKSNILTEDIHY